MFAELRELLRSEAIRRHQLGSKGIFVFLPVHFLQLLDQAVNRSHTLPYTSACRSASAAAFRLRPDTDRAAHPYHRNVPAAAATNPFTVDALVNSTYVSAPLLDSSAF